MTGLSVCVRELAFKHLLAFQQLSFVPELFKRTNLQLIPNLHSKHLILKPT